MSRNLILIVALGVPVGTCQTSYVDPLEGVHYVGYPVEDLVNLEEEDVIYLLLNKELPSPEQSDKFRAELAIRGRNTSNRCIEGIGITYPR